LASVKIADHEESLNNFLTDRSDAPLRRTMARAFKYVVTDVNRVDVRMYLLENFLKLLSDDDLMTKTCAFESLVAVSIEHPRFLSSELTTQLLLTIKPTLKFDPKYTKITELGLQIEVDESLRVRNAAHTFL